MAAYNVCLPTFDIQKRNPRKSNDGMMDWTTELNGSLQIQDGFVFMLTSSVRHTDILTYKITKHFQQMLLCDLILD